MASGFRDTKGICLTGVRPNQVRAKCSRTLASRPGQGGKGVSGHLRWAQFPEIARLWMAIKSQVGQRGNGKTRNLEEGADGVRELEKTRGSGLAKIRRPEK
jgi:hypothetical protein